MLHDFHYSHSLFACNMHGHCIDIIIRTMCVAWISNHSFYCFRYNGGTKHLLNYLLFDFCELTPGDFR